MKNKTFAPVSCLLSYKFAKKCTRAHSPSLTISTLIAFEHMLLGRCLKWICNSSPGSLTNEEPKNKKRKISQGAYVPGSQVYVDLSCVCLK